MAEAMQNDMVSLGGLWKETSQSGNTYLSGSLGGAKLMIFQNKNKEEGSRQPDYYMKLANKQKPQEGAESSSAPVAESAF